MIRGIKNKKYGLWIKWMYVNLIKNVFVFDVICFWFCLFKVYLF